MTLVNSGTKEMYKEVCVLIRVKPKYTEEFCIMMVACMELCNKVSKFKKLAEINKAFSVLGPFDFLLELREKKHLCSWNKISQNASELKKFLKEDFKAEWVTNLEPNFKNNTIVFVDNNNNNTIFLDEKGDKVILTINGKKTGEFVKKGDDDRVDIYRKEAEVDERINRTIFKIRETLGSYIYETHTLTKFELSEFLDVKCKKLYDYLENESEEVADTAKLPYIWKNDEFKECLEEETLNRLCGLQDRLKKNAGQQEIEAMYLFSWEKIPGNDNVRLIEFLNRHFAIEWVKTAKIEKNDGDRAIKMSNGKNYLSISLNDEKTKAYLKTDDGRTYEFIAKMENSKLNICKKITKHVHILIEVKPDCTEKFFLAMTIFKSLCNDPTSQYLAKIQNKTCSIIGPFDFLLELIAEGAEGEEEGRTKKINRTIFEIRETLGSCIYATHTIEKFRIPMTKEDLDKKKIGNENLVGLLQCDECNVLFEGYKPDGEIDLKEISEADESSLKKLLGYAKTFSEFEELNTRIIDLKSHVEELEKRQGLRQI